MATIIQGPPDARFAVIEQGVNRGVENYFQERERAKKEQKLSDAFAAINASTSYDQAVKAMGLVDREILANPQAMQLLASQIELKFPPQEAVTIDTPGGVETKAVRKGDVAGALSAAQEAGGRLASETELERKRTMEDEDQSSQLLDSEYKRVLGAERFKLEERRTKAAELKAQAALLKAKQGGSMSEKDKEIARITQLLGGDSARAMKIAYKLEDTDIDPATGEARILDKLTNRVAIVPAESLQDMDHVPTPKEGKTLWDAAIAGTGPFSALRAATSLPTAYLGVFQPEKTNESRQRLQTSVQSFIRAVANSERFPVAEQERIRKDFGLTPSIFVHPETMRRRMVTLDADLRVKLTQAERDSVNPQLPGKDRASAKRDVTEIRNFLSLMNVPEEHRVGQEQNVETLPASVQKAYPEVTFERWNRLNPAQKKRLLETSQETE